MKKFLILTIAITCGSMMNLANAAEGESRINTATNKIKIVPSLGYTYFNISGANSSYKATSGSLAGVLAQVPMDKTLTLESGLEYVETGAKQSMSFGWLELDTAQIKVASLAIPLRAKYMFNAEEVESTRYYIKGGLTPLLMMSAKLETGAESTDIKSELNNFDILTQAGFGGEWLMSGGHVNLDLSYNYGLTKVSKTEGGRNVGWVVQAGYAIDIN